MNGTNQDFLDLVAGIPKESRIQLEKARAAWVEEHAEREVEDWQRANPGPGYNDHPMAIDRYEEYCRHLLQKAEKRWQEKYDREMLPEALKRFRNTSGS